MEWSFLNWVGGHILGLENYHLAVLGFMFWAFRWYRSNIKEARKVGNKKFNKLIEAEIDLQMSFAGSDAYTDMESRVHELHDKDKKTVMVRTGENYQSAPLGTYKTGYNNSVKDVSSDIVKPLLLTMLVDDYDRYVGDDSDSYIVDGGHNIAQLFRNSLGRKVGISEISKCGSPQPFTPP